MKRALNFFDSTSKVLLAVGGLIAAAATLWATLSHLAIHPPKARPTKTSSPATRFVVAPEPCGALIFGADGAAGPVRCPDGRPNIAADRYYRQLHLLVLDLGPNASPAQVGVAICADLATGEDTFPIETRAVQLAEAEQAWHFGVDPASDIGPGLCPGTSPSTGPSTPVSAPPRSKVPNRLVGTWDGGSNPTDAKITFFARGEAELDYNNGSVIHATVVIHGSAMTLYLAGGRKQTISHWSIERIDAGYGYVFLNLSLDGNSYVRQINGG